MCGISGIFNFNEQTIAAPTKLIEKMNKSLAHRGPDDQGIWSSEVDGVFLGHRRLSIIDISRNGHQPMCTPAGNAIVFNGEVYNYSDIRETNTSQEYFSNSDTEVVLRHYERNGVKALNDFNGMFSFAIWDKQEKQLVLARDRIGIKPLYYTTQGGIFAFASEIRALLELPWVKKELDKEALYHFLTFSKVLPPATMFKGIKKMHPGHLMRVDRSGICEYRPYWEVAYQDLSDSSESAVAERTLQLLSDAVKQRMVSDVPVGAFLSGGVDSSAVVALMREHEPSAAIKTFSVGFEGQPGYSELEHARVIANKFGTEHFEKIVSAREMQDFLPNIVDVFDEPLSDPTCIPIYFISELAKSQGIKVVLTGDGADELFCGYNSWLRYVQLYPWYSALLRLPQWVRSAAANGWSAFSKSGVTLEMLHRVANKQEFFWGGANAFKESVKKELLQSTFSKSEGIGSYSQIEVYQELFNSIPKHGRNTEAIDWMCFLGVKTIVPNYYLHRADRLGMAHSVELRVPFLEHKLVNFGLSIPGSLKVKNSEPKFILKKALEGTLSKEVLYRKKMGFCVPIKEWGAQIMLDYLDANLSEFCEQTGLFNQQYLQQRISAYRNGQVENVFGLWNFYFLMSWFKRWMN